MKKEKLLIVDCHAIVFRSWFSIPERINSNNIDTRGAYGFINTLIKSIRENGITHIAVCFDTKAKTFRDEIFPEYKAIKEKDLMIYKKEWKKIENQIDKENRLWIQSKESLGGFFLYDFLVFNNWIRFANKNNDSSISSLLQKKD